MGEAANLSGGQADADLASAVTHEHQDDTPVRDCPRRFDPDVVDVAARFAEAKRDAVVVNQAPHTDSLSSLASGDQCEACYDGVTGWLLALQSSSNSMMRRYFSSRMFSPARFLAGIDRSIWPSSMMAYSNPCESMRASAMP